MLFNLVLVSRCITIRSLPYESKNKNKKLMHYFAFTWSCSWAGGEGTEEESGDPVAGFGWSDDTEAVSITSDDVLPELVPGDPCNAWKLFRYSLDDT